MQDEEFLLQFENCSLPKSEFNHRNHLRMSWLYLSRYPLEEAKLKIKEGIIRYAKSLGAEAIYDEALTMKWIQVIDAAMKENPGRDFEDFLKAHPALLDKNK